MQQIFRNIKIEKYQAFPPPFVSRVLLSWSLVDPYMYESTYLVLCLSHVNQMSVEINTSK